MKPAHTFVPPLVLGFVGLAASCTAVLGFEPAERIEPDGGATTSSSSSTGGMAGESCTNGKQDGKETSKDCGGGTCPACALGLACLVNSDCQSMSCKAGVCGPAQCDDGAKNGDETDVDCGGPECSPCDSNKACLVNADCMSEVCKAAVCASNHVWSNRLIAQTPVEVRDLATGGGSVLLAARGIVDFGGGPASENGLPANALAKFDAAGGLLWTKTFLGSPTGIDDIYGISANASGEVAVTGSFEGAVDFGGGPITAQGPLHATDVFIVRLGSDGSHVWSKGFGASGSQSGFGIALDGSGNVLVTGLLRNSIDFGGGALVANADGLGDVFLAKLGPAGGHILSKRFGDTGRQQGERVLADALGNVILAGTFEGAIDFAKGALNSAGGTDVFVAKFDSGGSSLLWSTSYGSAQDDAAPRIAVDSAGSVFVTSAFQGAMDLGASPVTSAGGRDIVLAKLSADKGEIVWSHRFGDVDDQSDPSIAVSSDGSLFLTGTFKGTIDLGGGPLTSVGDTDVFVAKFDTAGAHIWSRRYGDSKAQSAKGVVALAPDSAVLGGVFDGTLDFGGPPLMSLSGHDIFLARLLLP